MPRPHRRCFRHAHGAGPPDRGLAVEALERQCQRCLLGYRAREGRVRRGVDRGPRRTQIGGGLLVGALDERKASRQVVAPRRILDDSGVVGLATRAGQFACVEQEVDGIDEQPFPGGPIRGQPCRVQHQVAGGGPPGLDGQALRRDGDLGREFRIGNDRRRYPVAQPGPVVMGQLRGSQVQGRPLRRSKIMVDCRPHERMGEGDPVFQPGGLLDQQ